MQYWLSYDELLALATLARVKLLVEKYEDAYRCKGDNLDYIREPGEGLVICALRGGQREGDNRSDYIPWA